MCGEPFSLREQLKYKKMIENIIDDNILDDATEWYVLMRDEDISDSRMEGFIVWISQSTIHQQAFEQVGEFWDDLPNMKPAMGPNMGKEKKATVTSLSQHKQKIEQKTSQQKSLQNFKWSPRHIAASLAFLALSIVTYQYGSFLLMDTFGTKVGELADIMLDDGSHLVMNTNTAVRVDLRDDKRVVYLERGEVYFEVAKDQDRPFYVETKGGLVRVLGTKFNIRQRGPASDVSVVEGSVGVVDYGRMRDDFSLDQLDITLSADERFSLGDNQIDNVALPVDSKRVLSWRDRKLIYNGEKFVDLVADINRYYETDIRIGDPSLNDIEVVAILKIEDRNTTLKALETTFNVTARILSNDLILFYPNK